MILQRSWGDFGGLQDPCMQGFRMFESPPHGFALHSDQKIVACCIFMDTEASFSCHVSGLATLDREIP